MSEELRKQTTELRMKYNQYFRTNVAPQLAKFEQERKGILNILMLAFVACIVLAIVILIMPWDNWFLILPVFIFAAAFFGMGHSFQIKIKQKVMTTLLKAFGNDFTWSQTPKIGEDAILNSKLFNHYDRHTNDDNFCGTYKNLKLEISEFKLEEEHTRTRTDSSGNKTRTKTYETIFQGLLVSISMNKKFTGHTIVMENEQVSVIEKFVSNSRQSLNKVVLEDPEFNRDYAVYSTDQVESRYLLTTAFMERFKNVKQVFDPSEVSCSFKDNKILLAIDVRRDLFQLGSLFKAATDTDQYEKLFNELTAVLSFVDILKLDLNVGL